MMLTEAEARKQTCPLIRYCANETAVVQDGATAIYWHQSCHASDCKIGWRWAQDERLVSEDRLGFCGAFGKPEVTA